MRIKTVLLFLLVSLAALNASVYRSNALGQKLEVCEETASSGTFLVEEDGISTLITDGVTVWTETSSAGPDDATVITRVYNGSDERVQRIYRDGRLSVESRTHSGISTVTNYAYSDGKLIFTSSDAGSGNPSVRSFLRSSDSGQIAGVFEDGKIRLMSGNYLVQNGKVLESPVPGLFVDGEHRQLEDGNIMIDEGNDVVSVYSPQGQILRRSSGSREAKYNYRDGILLNIETREGNRTETEEYEDGKAVSLSVSEDGNLISLTVYREDGNIRTIYSNGRVIAVVYYRKDNRTVDRIEYN